MPKWNECSIYEEACRDGKCHHKLSTERLPFTSKFEPSELPHFTTPMDDNPCIVRGEN